MPSDWASLPARMRWKSGVVTSRSLAALSETASRMSLWASSPNGSRCCCFCVRVLRSVSWSVHSWSETIPFHGASTSCSPSSIAFARTTSSSAVRRATLPISLRYIRTGSSIPIMSAEIASRSSAVGSSTSAGSSFAGASSGSLLSTASPFSPMTSTATSPPSESSLPPRLRSSSSSSSSSSTLGRTTFDARRPRVASLASSTSARARRGRVRTASTSCLSSGSGMRAS